MNRFSLSVLILGVSAGFVAGCGGGPSGSGNLPPGNVTISAITGPDHLQIGVNSPATYVYSAAVSGSSDTAVAWSVDDSSLATIAASTGVATPSATKTGAVTITATAHADPTKTATLQVNVVDWILADYDAYLLIGENGTYLRWGSVLPSADSYEECTWSHDHLKFICIDGAAQVENTFYVFQTNGMAAGTNQISTVDLSSYSNPIWATNPRFSPDGKNIVFWGSGFVGLAWVQGPYVVDAAGKTAPILVANDPTFPEITFSAPRFTPDNKEILYAEASGLWIVNADGSNPRNLAPPPANQGLFSPDMSTLYYASNGCVYKANTDGTNPVCILSEYVVAVMDISPDGNQLVIEGPEVVSPTGGNIYVMNTNGSGLQQTYGLDFASW